MDCKGTLVELYSKYYSDNQKLFDTFFLFVDKKRITLEEMERFVEYIFEDADMPSLDCLCDYIREAKHGIGSSHGEH